MVDHQHTPDWSCSGCPADTAWPCDTARTDLAERYAGDVAGLAQYLAGLWCQATVDLGDAELGDELYARFFGWLRSTVA